MKTNLSKCQESLILEHPKNTKTKGFLVSTVAITS